MKTKLKEYLVMYSGKYGMAVVKKKGKNKADVKSKLPKYQKNVFCIDLVK